MITDPYIQYMYSYPHKTAYIALDQIDVREYFSCLLSQENSLYLHIPFCQYKCGYCNLFSVAGAEGLLMEEYINAVERQMKQYSEAMPEGVVFDDLTIGGGTPLMLSEELLERLFSLVEQYFVLKPDAPVIMETSPNQTTLQKLRLIKRLGVTRLSIGVQSFVEEELTVLCRKHSAMRARQALETIRRVNFDTLNIDLIYGIPGQTVASMLDSLEQALQFAPEELFIYPLYIKQGTELWNRKAERSDAAYHCYQAVVKRLLAAGYQQLSMRRFIRKKNGETVASKPCGYSNTLSFGCGGRSYLSNLHFCTPYAVKQQQCKCELDHYIGQGDMTKITYGLLLDEEEMKRRYVIKNLLFDRGIREEDYLAHYGEVVTEAFPVLKEWEQKEYVSVKEGFVSLTARGRSYSDYLGPMLMSDEVVSRMKAWRDGGFH